MSNHDYVIIDSKFSKEQNLLLYNRVCENKMLSDKEHLKNNSHEKSESSIFGRRTDTNFHKQQINEVDELISWIETSLIEASKNFSLNSITKQPSNQFDPNDFEIRQCWGATYKGHEWLMEHNHFPWTLSFVYYVSMPKGASGLMMGDDEIEMYEGDCIFFLGSQYHGVRPSHTMNDTRCVIAGNILYVPRI